MMLTACSNKATPNAPQATAIPPEVNSNFQEEMPVVRLNLSNPLDKPAAEISGLAWAGDWLVLLPQYPDRFENQLYRISRDDLVSAIQDPAKQLNIQPIKFLSAGLEKSVPGFEGFEAIAVNENDAYLTIETHSAGTKGYLVKGIWQDDYHQLTLDAGTLTEIPSQMNISNSSYESVLVFGQRVITLYEANGANINSQPQAQMFDLNLLSPAGLNFPTVEYRITDATPPDDHGEFWAINYFFPGDAEKLRPAIDSISQEYGQGETHSQSEIVERLLAFQFSEDGVVLAQKAPIQLQLMQDGEARNWEGLVRFEPYGFLLATDKFPATWLAFVAYP